MWAHMHDPPPRPSEVDPALAGFDAVVGRALAKDPVARFPSASDLTRAVREGFAGTGPVARPGPAAPVKLPHPPTPFLGRERELQDVVELLLGEDVRLVTLTGPGGTGKTRLALRAAEEAAPAFPEGVYWVGLATLRDPDLVLETIARALGAKHGAVEELMGRRALLLLDNFEQVVEAASSLASLLDACPDLSVLVTSRETLRVHAELEYQVPPLETEEAVTLFCRRARQEPSETVAELCRRLDNLPLAVELAAARAKALSPTQILERLSSRLDLLKGGRDADPRQETLRATIDWSYDLLAPDEQQLFRRLSVFAGGCVLEAAEEVCGADVDTMQSLLEKSLLRLADERYWMLETIREYGASRLETTAESAAVHGRHLTYVLDLALDADARMTGSEQSRQLTRVEVEHANVRRALAWGVENDPERALRLAVALQRYFYVHGHSAEGLRALELALEGAPDAPPQLRARALRAAGSLAGGIGDVVRGRAYLESSLEPLRNLSDRRELAVALNNLGAVASRQADVDGARAFLVESLELKRELGDRHGTAMSLSNLGMVEAKASNLEVARASQEEALATFRELGDESAIINSLIALAEVSLLREERVQARAFLDEALLLSEGIGDRAAAVEALALVARVALADGDGATARDAAGQAAEHASALDDDAYTIVVALEAAADVFVDQEALTQAVGLRATAARVRAESGMAPWPVERRQSDRTLERARDLLPPDVYARASAAGSSSPTDDALALAASLA
jgi:non-specific serine/threonine protein kinase